MRPHTIALIATSGTGAAERAWWEPLFRHWPAHATPPRVELLTPEEIAGQGLTAHQWREVDAAVIAPLPGGPDTLVYRTLDTLQQSQIPTLILITEPARLERFNPGSVIPQPLNADPAVTAAMLYALAQRQAAVRGMDQNLRLAQSFQGETAAEIDKLHQELLLAAKVQRDFLPKHMPTIDGVDAAVLFRPAGFVSGDTYDVTRLDEYHIGFFLADAMGHGVPAALMTLYIAGSLPQKEIGPNGYRIVPPSESLSRLNAELAESMAGPARFVTAVCGVIDTRTGQITLACAGHPPPLRVGRHGVKPVDVSGMLLGVVPDFDYQQVTIKLDEDELLVLHSDGLENAMAGRSGTEGVLRPTPKHWLHIAGMRRGRAAASLQDAMEFIATDIDAQAGSFHQDDDLTILAFQTTSVREPLRGRTQTTEEVSGGIGG